MTTTRRIVLIGLSGSGKSTVGRALAARLGWTLVDTDEQIVAHFGTTIDEVFAQHGEAAFRQVERAALTAALERDEVVIACGGGAVVPPEVWSDSMLRRPGTLVVTLDVEPATTVARLQAHVTAEGANATRPLLAGDNPLGRVTAMKLVRQSMYDQADLTLITEGASPAQLANEIAWLVQFPIIPDTPTIELAAASGDSAIYIAPGALAALGSLTRSAYPSARRAWVVTDSVVGPLHAAAAVALLTDAGFTVAQFAIPAGEASKTLTEVSRVYDWLLAEHIERADVIVALGGGVVGDLAGFVAATVLRGVGFVQVPTSLLAMVDSSVGGKTGVDHPAGKNLIGAFYQPRVVVIDPTLLATLPPRQVTNGLAEIIKHAIIQPSTPGGDRADLLRFHERNATQLRSDASVALPYLIRRNVALKAAVVAADEREAHGRAFLNFGHTLGHAIEAANYDHLHGEAIAIGMRGEALLGVAAGAADQATADRIAAVVAALGLPTSTSADSDAVLRLIENDKKRAAGKVRWVLPLTGGGVAIRDDVAPEAVTAAITAVRRFES